MPKIKLKLAREVLRNLSTSSAAAHPPWTTQRSLEVTCPLCAGAGAR